jgi:AraC-like DNA-binding protein
MNHLSASACICVLDSHGEILFTSQGWREFFSENSSSPISILEPGINVCELSELPLTDPAAWIQSGVKMVLSHSKDDFNFEFSVPSSGAKSKRVIRVEITPLGAQSRGCQVVALDITESRRASPDRTFFSRLESLTSEASLRLTRSSTSQIDENITASLAEVSLLAGVDYSFVTRFHVDPSDGCWYSSMTHFWHPDPIPDFHLRFQRIPIKENPYREASLSNQSVLLSDVERLPDRFKAYREQCKKFGIKSVATVPIMVDGSSYGYVGFVATKDYRYWTDREIMILRVLSEIFGAAFSRQRIESSLREREKSMLAFYRETEDPVWCFGYASPIPIHLPVEKQLEQMFTGSVEDCNDAAARLVGRQSRNEVMSAHTKDVLGEPSESFLVLLRRFIRDGYRSVNARAEMQALDGSMRTWMHQAQGVVQDGKLIRVWVSTQDVTESPEIQYKNSSLTREEIQDHVAWIEKVMKQERPYLDPNFNLTKLSKLARLPDYQLSQVLNMGMKTNFYDLVNRYRIERLMELWSDSSRDEVSILDLAFEVGFNSKSTFNTAFKKFTGKTPSAYRAELQLRRGEH